MSAPRAASDGLRPIRRLAIVNRGEAAMRCLRAVASLREAEGSVLECIALYTEVDRRAPFVRRADRAVALDDARGAVAAYLDRTALVELLLREEVDAVWPGWGFLAEDPEFVERLADAGIRFLGPPAEAMRAVGDKIGAKAVAEAAGVPVVPWSGGAVASAEAARAAADALGYPVALKASAGGGGRGIRMITSPEAIEEAFRSARAEAQAAFGDDRLFVERCIAGGRHVEIQLVADEHGTVLSLGGRDCSVQRRHQKVLEEAPPPGLAPGVLARLEEAACAMARSVGYRGVGTAEFLVTPDAYHFLELNPRLQVEHGVTEAVTGWDLVQWQIRIARGEALPATPPETRGVAIEARVCAEDPDADFRPAPGRVTRFEPSLGPGVRIDTGVVTGADVPAAFDSLVAKVIAHGEDREQTLGRLRSALTDLDLVVHGGATNEGFLLSVLASPEFRDGPVDTTWLDRFVAARRGSAPFAVEALVAAAVLVYQRARRASRTRFYADASEISPDRIPPSNGQVLDLVHRGESYRLEVYAVGGWGYRVHMDGRALFVVFEEEGDHTGRLSVGERGFHVVHDASGSDLRVEIEGHPHRFGRDTAGQVRAGTPAMVVAIHVRPGDAVSRGDTLGVLEAMKTEIRFEAPIAGTVKEVVARVGAHVAASDVLLVIEPEAEGAAANSGDAPRLTLPEVPDPLAPLLASDGAVPDLAAADSASAAERRDAFRAVRTEVRRVLLGYDANHQRTARLAEFLEAPLPAGLSDAFLWRLAEIRHELTVFADVERLFVRSQHASVTGSAGPSNHARLRMFVRRLRAGGAGVHEDYLALVRRALAHYGVLAIDGDTRDELERAVLRLLATQHARALRHRLVGAALGRIVRLAQRGVHLGDDTELRAALGAIVGLRGLVSDGLADAALEARYQIFERPEIERRAERTSKQVEAWLGAAEADPAAPPGPVLAELAVAPRAVFERVGGWLGADAAERRSVALGAHVMRLYHPRAPRRQVGTRWDDAVCERLEFCDGRTVLAVAARFASAASALARLAHVAGARGVDAAELLVTGEVHAPERERLLDCAAAAGIHAGRVTVGWVAPGGVDRFHRFDTLVRENGAFVRASDLHGVHPEVASRIELARLAAFDLERLDAEDDGLYAFRARAKESHGDERLFVLADVHGAGNGPDAGPHIPVFERMFHAATRTLRQLVARHDPKRRLQWNRIALFVAPPLVVTEALAGDLARRLAPATRHLGLEKVVVRLRLLDAERPRAEPRTLEIEISELPGSRMDLRWREPRTRPIEVRSAYERRVGEARRRGLVEPYEIVRMLCGGRVADEDGEPSLPPSSFEEFDLIGSPGDGPPQAVSVAGRSYGRNEAGVVFGIVTTPTPKVPEGMRRVLVLSDPTRNMGALAAPECDRLVAALDLAMRERIPVEWVPVSSGARIAMDSGTENLDATARVARRIVECTDAGLPIHVIVNGVNVGAQSYFDALATMGGRTRGVLIMTPRGSMVLTGRAALAASGAVSAEDEVSIGGYERVMGPNGEAQYRATDLADAYRILYEHYHFSYVVPGEAGPRRHPTEDPPHRDVTRAPCRESERFAAVGEIFDDATNPGRKAPFAMRDVMAAVIDADGGWLERWRDWVGAETAITWDAHLGGHAVTLIGIESQPVMREGFRPLDGPESWTGGTLFPLSSKKVARALAAASGQRPVVVLANLSGFDGSPESMRKLQLEYGAEIARAVVNFDGPILFTVVSRYHGGAYVVFSGALNPALRPAALAGSYASVIGGGPAAAVVFPREVRARAAADPRIAALEVALRDDPSPEARARLDHARSEVLLEKQAELAAEFDRIHTVERARAVGSLESIVAPRELRPFLIRQLERIRAELDAQRANRTAGAVRP